jgi:hypothetical protein
MSEEQESVEEIEEGSEQEAFNPEGPYEEEPFVEPPLEYLTLESLNERVKERLNYQFDPLGLAQEAFERGDNLSMFAMAWAFADVAYQTEIDRIETGTNAARYGLWFESSFTGAILQVRSRINNAHQRARDISTIGRISNTTQDVISTLLQSFTRHRFYRGYQGFALIMRYLQTEDTSILRDEVGRSLVQGTLRHWSNHLSSAEKNLVRDGNVFPPFENSFTRVMKRTLYGYLEALSDPLLRTLLQHPTGGLAVPQVFDRRGLPTEEELRLEHTVEEKTRTLRAVLERMELSAPLDTVMSWFDGSYLEEEKKWSSRLSMITMRYPGAAVDKLYERWEQERVKYAESEDEGYIPQLHEIYYPAFAAQFPDSTRSEILADWSQRAPFHGSKHNIEGRLEKLKQELLLACSVAEREILLYVRPEEVETPEFEAQWRETWDAQLFSMAEVDRSDDEDYGETSMNNFLSEEAVVAIRPGFQAEASVVAEARELAAEIFEDAETQGEDSERRELGLPEGVQIEDSEEE